MHGTVQCEHTDVLILEQQTGSPHRHNTIPEKKGFIRSRTAWRCVICHGLFDERPDAKLPWEEQCDLDREDAIEFEQEVHRSSMDWNEREVGWNEYGAWFGCRSIHVIEEEP